MRTIWSGNALWTNVTGLMRAIRQALPVFMENGGEMIVNTAINRWFNR
ncbi:hypothetical protein [Lysinibacillus sphaericus]|nr:hypothetical protein [Lysinibacillus sphaericus]